MSEFVGAMAGSGPVFLADPGWGSAERARLDELLQSCIVHRTSYSNHGYLCIPTGGTSGRLRFARHDGETLAAAVRGFVAHFGAARVNAVGMLPLHHVSGLMAWLRSALTGGTYLPASWIEIQAGRFPNPEGSGWFVSLVPTQLQRLIDSAAARQWLGRFEAILIGGGPLWPELAERAAKAGLRLAPGYGMTETAAMATALRPEEFLAGDRSSGRALPHARVSVGPDGAIAIQADSLFRGYWPDDRVEESWTTQDLGRIDERGHLHVLGRVDDLIITGGEKVSPAEVEAALVASGAFADVAVIGLPDPQWGEAVVACHPAARVVDEARVAAALMGLAAFKHPKRFIAVAAWPRNALGKINRAALKKQALETDGKR